MKLIIMFSERTFACAILEHNVPIRDAEERVAHYRARRMPAYHLHQPKRHDGEVETCKACYRLVQKALSKEPR